MPEIVRGISISIMSVPERADHVAAMCDRLSAQICAAHLDGLSVSGIGVHVDSDKRGPWESWKAAWLTHRSHGCSHHVVLQDDIVFCEDLPHALIAVAKARPNDVVSGFLPRKSVTTAHDSGLRWVRTRRFLWGQCVMMPVSLGDRILDWVHEREAANIKEWRRHDDVRVAAFLDEHDLPVYVAVPNLVEHIGDELGSVMGHNGPPGKRRARVWVGHGQRAGHLDWENLEYVRE